MLHKILTTVTALAVVASLLAGAAGQAAAVSGYDSAYFGESAFLTLGPGQSGQFAVGFNNTGSTGWLTGSTSQVDLAICLPDKVTCNTTSPNAAFASSWLSSTAYATTSTTFVGPGQTGYFTYNVTVPSGTAPGTYRFNGDVALHGTASMIHPQGYYQDVAVPSVGAPAALQCSLAPTSLVAGTTATATETVTVVDALGNPVTTNNGYSITLSQAGNPTTIASSNPATTTNGVATFTINAPAATGTTQLSAAGTPATIAATLAGCNVNLTGAAAGAPAALSVSFTNGYAYPAGVASTTPVNATLKDSGGNTTTATAATTVTFTVDNTVICNFGGAASITGAINVGTTGTAASATSPTLTLTGVPGTCTVTASATGLTSGSKTATIAAAGPANKLAITSNTCTSTPTTSSSSTSTCDIVVQVQDAAGNPVFLAGTSIIGTFTANSGSTCSATATSTPAATAGSGTGIVTAPTDASGKVDYLVSDAIAETCTFTATSAGLTSTSGTASFTGFGPATRLTATASPNPIPANGVATSTITVCVRDQAGNKVTTASDSISLIKTVNAGATNLTSSNPTNAASGCASFTVQATTTVGTDTYQAFDNSRTLSGLGGTATPTVNVRTQ